ncbi:MAG: RCC1-like domain-containing protein, partial [Flavobacterium sp.]
PSQIACGSSHTIVLMTDGTVYGTGNNGSGQLGDGTTTNKNTLTLTTFNNMKYIMNNNLLDTPTLSNFSVPPKTFGDSSFNLVDPSSNSNGAFSYTSSNTSVATIVGRTVTIVGAGTSVITATQAATINYTSASTTANFLVNPATPTLSNFSVLSKTFGDTPFPITQPTSNSSGALSYTSSNASVATIVGNNVTIVGAGTSLITATQEASGNYTEGTIDASFQVLSNTPSNPVDVTSGEQFMYFLYSPAQYAGIENDITVVENLTNQSTDKKTILNISDTIVEIIKSLGI